MISRTIAFVLAMIACGPSDAETRLPGFASVSGEGRVRVASLDRAVVQGFRDIGTVSPAPARGRHPIVPFLRDRTMRVGDSVVLDGRVVTLRNDSHWPLSIRDFDDFRTTKALRERHRSQIEELVRVAEREARVAELRKSMVVVMAPSGDGNPPSVVALRGPIQPTAVRVVSLIR